MLIPSQLSRILVALDGSPEAERILPMVAGLARAWDATIVLVRSADPDYVPPATPTSLSTSPASPSLPGALTAPAHGVSAPVPPVVTGDARTMAPVPPEDLATGFETSDTDAAGYLNILHNSLRDAGLKVEAVVGEGAPATAILELAESHPDSIIAMARRNRGGLQRFFMGSVTDEVLRRARCPVLLVRVEDEG